MQLSFDQALERGIALHKEGKLQEAVHFYKAILESSPSHPDANHNLGLIALSIGKASSALPLFKAAIEGNPKIEQYWLSYINTLLKEEQFELAEVAISEGKKQGVSSESLSIFEKLSASGKGKKVNVDLGPNNAELEKLLALYQSGSFEEAEKLALSITKEFPNHVFAWKTLGALFSKQDRMLEALSVNQRAVELMPEDSEAQNNLGTTLKSLGKLEDAESAFRNAISLNSSYSAANSNLGNLLKEQKRTEEAKQIFENLVEIHPNDALFLNNLGSIQLELKELENAKTSYQKAIDAQPDYHKAHNNLGVVLYELGQFEKASVSYEKALVLNPEYAYIII